MVSVDELNAVQDKVFADQALWPKETDGDHMTFCNVAALHVAQGVGCHDFDPPAGTDPIRADKLYNLFKYSPLFHQQPMQDCQDLVNKGALILAILPSWVLRQQNGHICTLTSGVGDHSGRWDRFAPFCLNLGRAGTCFRQKGVNWAFQMMPEFYLWRTT
jgi:hypothetical protein